MDELLEPRSLGRGSILLLAVRSRVVLTGSSGAVGIHASAWRETAARRYHGLVRVDAADRSERSDRSAKV